MKAQSIKGNSAQAIEAALEDQLGQGFNPTLAFVFLSIDQNRLSIARILDDKGIAVFGATTNGQFIDERNG